MKALEVTTNVGCRIRCRYCPQDKLTKAYVDRSNVKYLGLREFETILSKLPIETRIDFSGMAEPWLNPQCTEMVHLAHRRGHVVSVFSTGVGMDPKDVERLRLLPFGNFVVHLPDREGLTGIVVNDNYLKTIRAIVDANIRGCQYMTMGILHPEVKKVTGRRISPTRMMSRAGNVAVRADIPIPPRLRGVIRCKSSGDLLDHNVLLPNGEVILCCMDYGLRHVLGNLLTGDYEFLFKNDEFYRLVEGLNDDSSHILCRCCENACPIEEYNRPPRKSIFHRIFGI